MTLKQKLFIKNLLKVLNGAEAARLTGYSKRSAKEIAYQLLKKPEIRNEVDKRFEERDFTFIHKT